VHRSVKIRMDAEGLEGGKYSPRAKFDHVQYEWVDWGMSRKYLRFFICFMYILQTYISLISMFLAIDSPATSIASGYSNIVCSHTSCLIFFPFRPVVSKLKGAETCRGSAMERALLFDMSRCHYPNISPFFESWTSKYCAK
jgi:hypothetical protein